MLAIVSDDVFDVLVLVLMLLGIIYLVRRA